MKNAKSLRIYIASSFRNLYAVQLLTQALIDRGHEVDDWTALPAPLPSDMPVSERRERLDADPTGEIFKFCLTASTHADLVIYLGPSGQDAGWECGAAYMAGVPVYGLRGPLEAPGTMLYGGAEWFESYPALIEAVEKLAEAQSAMED